MCTYVYVQLVVLWAFRVLDLPDEESYQKNECFTLESVLQNVFKKFNNVSWGLGIPLLRMHRKF